MIFADEVGPRIVELLEKERHGKLNNVSPMLIDTTLQLARSGVLQCVEAALFWVAKHNLLDKHTLEQYTVALSDSAEPDDDVVLRQRVTPGGYRKN
jgi:hypothetical protein